MELLSHEDRGLDAKEMFGPVAGVVGVPAGVIRHNILGLHALVDGVLHHRLRLVVVLKAVIPAHEQLVDLSSLVQGDARVQTILQDGRWAAIRIDSSSENDANPLVTETIGLAIAIRSASRANVDDRGEPQGKAHPHRNPGPLEDPPLSTRFWHQIGRRIPGLYVPERSGTSKIGLWTDYASSSSLRS